MRNSENSNFERKVKSILEQDDELFEESRAQIMNKLKGNNTKEK